MKRTQVLATLALAFMLGVAVPTTAFTAINNAQAYAQTAEAGSGNIMPTSDVTETPATGATANVSTAEELAASLADNNITNITLTADIANVNLDITRANSDLVTIDLNGHTISSTSKWAFLLSQGNVKFTGTGTITSTGNALMVRGSTDPNATNYSTLTVDSGVTLHTDTLYGIAVSSYDSAAKQNDSYGVTVNMNGTITGAYGMHVNGLIMHLDNRPQMHIGNTAVITTDLKSDSTPIYAAGSADWYIGSAQLTGKAGLGIKAGNFTFTNTTILTNGIEATPSAGAPGIEGTSVVFQLEHHAAYQDNISIDINGGNYSSDNSNVFYEYGANASSSPAQIKIANGNFTAGTDKAIFGGSFSDRNVTISGGIFKGTDLDTVKSFLVEGLTLDSNGQVISTPIADSTITDREDNVSVTGKFAQSGLTLEATALDEEGYGKDLFGDRQFVAYQLTIHDADGQTLTELPAGMQISIKVPANISGTRSNIYRISDDNKTITKIDSVYKNGALVFSSDTLGRFAVVEETDISTNTPGSGTGTSSTIFNEDATISISGDLGTGKYFVRTSISDRQIAAFGLTKYALYDINLLNSAGVKVNPDGAVVVSIKVPQEIDGSKSSIYAVAEDGQVEKLKSTYANGVISFTTTHFSLYAIVEDGGPESGSLVSTPETGTLAHQGIISAVSSMMPVLAVAGMMFALFGRKLIARRRAEAMAGVECEIVADAKAIIEEVESEPQIERFVATPMTAADEEEIKAQIFGADQK